MFTDGSVVGVTKRTVPGVFHIYVSTTPGAKLDGSSTGTSVQVPEANRENGWFQLSHTCKYTGVPEASVKVTKEWVVTTNGGEPAAPTTTPGEGFSAQLVLDDVNKSFGTTYDGYEVDDVVEVAETGVTVPQNCVATGSSGTGDKTLKAGLNEYTVTNNVTCRTSPDDASVKVTKEWVVTTNGGDPAAPTTTPGDGLLGAAASWTMRTRPSVRRTTGTRRMTSLTWMRPT